MSYPTIDPKFYYHQPTTEATHHKSLSCHPLPLHQSESLCSIALSMATTRSSFPPLAGGGPLISPPPRSIPHLNVDDHYKGLGMKEILEIADDFLWADEDPLMTAKVHDIAVTTVAAPSTSAHVSASSFNAPVASRVPSPAPFGTPDCKDISGSRRVAAVRSVTTISSPASTSRFAAPHQINNGLSPSVVSLDSPQPSVVTLHSPSRQLKKRPLRVADRTDGVVDDDDDDGDEVSSSIASIFSDDEDDNEYDEFAGDHGTCGGEGLDDSEHSNLSQESNECRLRPYQAGQWTVKFHELCQYRQKHGNCLVPHNYKPNMLLARWVKRQRYQYKLLKEGKASTMTEERAAALKAVGFVWDSQESAWEERLMELKEFRALLGHCNVPCTYRVNPPLAAWVKCQRRQYKLYRNGKPSNITAPRIQQLENLGFEWEPRVTKRIKMAQGHTERRNTRRAYV